MEAVIDEDIEGLESLEQLSLTETKIAVMDEDEPEADENLVGVEKLSFAEAQSMLQKVCGNARSLGIETINLHRCMKEMREAQQKKPKKATMVHDFFQKKN
jgi:hypothetical protein